MAISIRFGLTTATLIASLGAPGCATDDDAPDLFGDAIGSTSMHADASTTGALDEDTTSGQPGSTGDEGGTGPRFDVGGSATAADDGGQRQGCRGIDFLFVVDNSGSMLDEQISLVSSFPGFVSAIEATLEDKAKDFHVMVVDTDDGESMEPPAAPGTCDAELGAGLVSKPNHFDCGVPDGVRYLTNADPNLPGAFGCLAYVGIQGSGAERSMEAATRALSDLSQPGACNEGFVRDDALLVLTFITDEEDIHSSGDPVDWFDTVVFAKHDDPSSIVTLGLIGDSDQPAPVCDPGQGQAAPRLRAFIESFGSRGLAGSVCAPDYAPFFEQAIDVIDQACDDFVPPQG